MGFWSAIQAFFSLGGSAAGGAALGGIPGAVEGVGKGIEAGAKAVSELNRGATERGIAKQVADKDREIEERVNAANRTPPVALWLAILLPFALSCASVPGRSWAIPGSNVDRLMARPDFASVARAAPDWTKDSLHTVNALEGEVQRLRAQINQVR